MGWRRRCEGWEEWGDGRRVGRAVWEQVGKKKVRRLGESFESPWLLTRSGCAVSLWRKDGCSENVLSAWWRGGNKKQKDNMPKKLYFCQHRQVGSSNSPPTQMSNPCCFQVNTTLNETCACRLAMAENLLHKTKPSSWLNARRSQNHLVGSNNQSKESPRKHRSHTGRWEMPSVKGEFLQSESSIRRSGRRRRRPRNIPQRENKVKNFSGWRAVWGRSKNWEWEQ